MNNNQFNNILIVKHGSLGDIAFSLTAMASIKKNFSYANIIDTYFINYSPSKVSSKLFVSYAEYECHPLTV